MKLSLVAALAGLLFSTIAVPTFAQGQIDGAAVFRSQLPSKIIFSGSSGGGGDTENPSESEPLAAYSADPLSSTTQIGTFFSTQLSASGGTPPYSFQFSGSAPAGWTISGNTIAGTMGDFGILAFDVVARDSAVPPQSSSIGFATDVTDATPLSTSLAGGSYAPGAVVNQAAPAVLGNDGPVSFTLVSGSLPPGLEISAAGAMAGTVTGGFGTSGQAVVRLADPYSHLDLELPWTISAPSAATTIPVGALFKISGWDILADHQGLRDENVSTSVVGMLANGVVLLDLGADLEGNYVRVAGNSNFTFRVVTGTSYTALNSWGSTQSATANTAKTIDFGYPLRAHRYVGIQILTAPSGSVGITELRYGMGGVLP